MDNGIISVRYARALYNTAKETGLDKEIYGLLEGFAARYEENIADMNAVFENPVVTQEQRLQLLMTAIGNDVPPLLDDFLRLVVERHREGKMYFIAKKYGELYRNDNRILQARLVSATPLSSATLTDIKSFVEKESGSQIEIHEAVDPSIIGGFILDVDSKRYDVSISQQLRQLKNKL